MRKTKTAKRQTESKRGKDEKKERAKLIFECLKRNKRVQETVKKARQTPPGTSFDSYKELKDIIPSPTMANLVVMMIITSGKNIPNEFIKSLKQSTIDIQYPVNDVSSFLPLDYEESQKGVSEYQKYEKLKQNLPTRWKKVKIGRLLAIQGVDQKEKTITIRIRLRHDNEAILADMKYLLQLLREEGKYFNVNLGSPKPHWGEYRNYLRVYDLYERYRLRKDKGWKEIGFEVYKVSAGDFEKAREKAKKAYNKAKELINGGWQQL